ncbi:Protein-L-isoaspartate O-methyltransferase domain-containing protein 1 [Schistosoma japonicum]|nr:Protein-L-isoaspartate O-methyltransferase domain-containing protein 1 [Schistosoma japonicum]KAH8866830.1 Protein-L-isoaspartate O-methyltransferase domain-containing protein 1 [Schistosoma japonicum]
MGGHVSRGRDNQSLIDELLRNGLTLDPEVERALRLVDRGHYVSEKGPRAYMDMAWRSGSLHLSAPSIYIVALKNLDIQPGNRFLNVGSGTGYLSTVIGLLLGYNGVNHGIEVNDFNVNFSREHLVTFMSECDAPFERSFCPPVFLHGNILDLVIPSDHQENITDRPNVFPQPSEVVRDNSYSQVNNNILRWPVYDRIYVGAAVTNLYHLQSILRLLKVGGIVVVPYRNKFMKIRRIEENKITASELMSVSFSTLLSSKTASEKRVKLPPEQDVISLEQLAARLIRTLLRNVIEFRHNGPPSLGRIEETEEGESEMNRVSNTNEDSDNSLSNPDTEVPDESNRENCDDILQSRSSLSQSCSMARFLYYLINHAEIGQGRSQSPFNEDSNSDRTNSSDAQSNTTEGDVLDTETEGSDHTTTGNRCINSQYLRINFRRFLNGVSNTIIATTPYREHSNNDNDNQSSGILNTEAYVDNELKTDAPVKSKSTLHKQRKKCRWIPPSYTYKEEMQRILSEELHLGKPLIRSVISL